LPPRIPVNAFGALTLAGLIAIGLDQDLAMRSLGRVLAFGAEIADDWSPDAA
jgi:hypothetical protein